MAVTAELRLIVSTKELRLMLLHGTEVVEDEVWVTKSQIPKSDAKELCKALFDDAYDLANTALNGE